MAGTGRTEVLDYGQTAGLIIREVRKMGAAHIVSHVFPAQ